MISKFKDVLMNEDLEPEKLRDAIKTLNEQVHHQVSQRPKRSSPNQLYLRRKLQRK